MYENQVKCWEKLNCNQINCRLYKSDELFCWLASDTCSKTEAEKSSVDKIINCFECEVFKTNIMSSDMTDTCRLLRDKFIEYSEEISQNEQEKRIGPERTGR